jgi:hypothetical protein
MTREDCEENYAAKRQLLLSVLRVVCTVANRILLLSVAQISAA